MGMCGWTNEEHLWVAWQERTPYGQDFKKGGQDLETHPWRCTLLLPRMRKVWLIPF